MHWPGSRLQKMKSIKVDKETKSHYKLLNDSINEFVEIAPLAVHFYDHNANLIDCNQVAMHMYDMDDKQDYIDNYFMFMPFNQPDGRRSQDVMKTIVQEALENGRSGADVMYRKADGVPMLMKVTCVCLNSKGSPVVTLFSTEVRAETSNRDLEADIRATLMLDSTPMACFLADSNSKALDCNAEALQLFGYASKNEATKHFSEICPKTQTMTGQDIEGMDAAISKALASGRHNFEFTCFDIVGKPIPCKITLVRIYYRREHVVAIYIQDLREMKAIIEEIKRIEIAEEESRAKSRFLAQMSHEIRTPLNAILGLSEVQLLVGNHTEEIEDIFIQIYTSSNLLLSIINDLLDLSKVEAEKLSIISLKYEVATLIADTVQLNLIYVGDKEIDFKLEVSSNVPNTLIGDELRIKQVINNLLSNAFKYTPKGTVKLRIGVETSEKSDEVVLVIRVSDTGIGMTKEQTDNLFSDEYVRFNEEKTHKLQGTGLGMLITHQLLTMMDGSISVDSQLGVGTEFFVKVPQKKHNEDLLGDEVVKNLGSLNFSQRRLKKIRDFVHENMSYGRVLVVDDTESNLYVIQSMLAPYGIYVDTANNGQEAIDKVKTGEVFDIIFMDHMMVGLDGIETARKIKELGYKHPIVALTASALVGQEELFRKEKFADFLTKPIDVHKLDKCLMRFVRDKQSKEVIKAAQKMEIIPQQQTQNISVRLAKAFLKDAESAVEALENWIASGSFEETDMKRYTVTVHGMKSALGNIGEYALSEEAYTLEKAGKDGDVQTIINDTSKFIGDLKELITKHLSEEDAEQSDAKLTKKQKEFLKTNLILIQKVCENFDIVAVQKATEEIRERVSGKQVKIITDKIEEYLLHSDFDKIIEVAQEVLSQTEMTEED